MKEIETAENQEGTHLPQEEARRSHAAGRRARLGAIP